MRFRRARFIAGLTAVMAVMALMAPTGPANAADGLTGDDLTTIADAQACSVVSGSDIRCFASAEEMAAATGSRAGSKPQAREADVSAAGDCAGISYYWLYLYEHPNYGGRIIQFNDVNFWQNLGDYGFDNRTSSYWNDTYCYAYLADGAWGGGAHMGMPSGSWSGGMGWWDNRPSSLLISG